MLDTIEKPETVRQRLQDSFMDIHDGLKRSNRDADWVDWVTELLSTIHVSPVFYTNGCEVPPTGHRKWYLKIQISTNAVEHLYKVYLKTKFNLNFHQLVCIDENSFRLKFLPEHDHKALTESLNDTINRYLEEGRHRNFSGIGEVLYNQFAQLDAELFEFNLKRNRLEEERFIKDVQIQKELNHPWWKFWK